MEIFQIAQRAVDLDRAAAFYARLLGAEPTGVFDPPGLVFFQIGQTRLLIDKVAPSALLYLKVPDVQAMVEQCRADGVAIVAEPHVIFTHTDDSLGPAGTQEWMAFIADSEDNTLGLVSHRAVREG